MEPLGFIAAMLGYLAAGYLAAHAEKRRWARDAAEPAVVPADAPAGKGSEVAAG